MGTGMDTVSTANTEIMIKGYLFTRPVVTVLYRTRGNTGVAIYTFFLVNLNKRCQCVCIHNSPSRFVISVRKASLYHRKAMEYRDHPAIPNSTVRGILLAVQQGIAVLRTMKKEIFHLLRLLSARANRKFAQFFEFGITGDHRRVPA
jgi:hypothetical protein